VGRAGGSSSVEPLMPGVMMNRTRHRFMDRRDQK